MKITLRPQKQAGSALLITMMVTGSVGFVLASYLQLVAAQNKSVMRSLAWNSSIPVIEAVVEEALMHIKKNKVANLSADGWYTVYGVSLDNGVTLLGGIQYLKKRWIGKDFALVTISQSTPPTIYAKGYVRNPTADGYLPHRIVRITTRGAPMFVKGLVAKDSIVLNGNGVSSDSFDSMNPLYSTGGRYDPAKTKDGGDVGSNSSEVGTINQGNADIYGKVSTGPGGTVTLGPNGAAGSKTWINGGKTGIEPGWFTDDMNVEFPPVADPFTSGYTTPSGNPVVISSSGNYQISSLTTSLIISNNANVVLRVTDNIKLSGTDSITILSGSNLKLYMVGESANIAGNGVVNKNGNALSFQYYGLPSNTDLTISGNGAFIGTIYAPSAVFTMNGGGSTTQDFIGAAVVGNATMNGKFQFHYDENLGTNGPTEGWQIATWNEI